MTILSQEDEVFIFEATVGIVTHYSIVVLLKLRYFTIFRLTTVLVGVHLILDSHTDFVIERVSQNIDVLTQSLRFSTITVVRPVVIPKRGNTRGGVLWLFSGRVSFFSLTTTTVLIADIQLTLSETSEPTQRETTKTMRPSRIQQPT